MTPGVQIIIVGPLSQLLSLASEHDEHHDSTRWFSLLSLKSLKIIRRREWNTPGHWTIQIFKSTTKFAFTSSQSVSSSPVLFWSLLVMCGVSWSLIRLSSGHCVIMTGGDQRRVSPDPHPDTPWSLVIITHWQHNAPGHHPSLSDQMWPEIKYLPFSGIKIIHWRAWMVTIRIKDKKQLLYSSGYGRRLEDHFA